MKIQKKTKRRFAGLLFLFIAVIILIELNSSTDYFRLLMEERDGWGNQSLWENEFSQVVKNLAFNFVGTIIFYIMGIFVLTTKRAGVVLHCLALLYMIVALVFMQGAFIVLGIYAAALLFLHLGGGIFTAPPQNEVIHAQMQRQTLLYNQQLKAGILTKEEYNQMIQNKK